MSEANDEQEVVLVKLTCAICHELMELEAHDAPRQVACPYCEREVTVPSRTQVQVLYPRVRHRSPDEIGDYGVTAPPEPPPVPRPTVAPPVGERLPARFATKIPCPQCKKLVGTRLEERPKRINCPECGAFVQVPARDAADPPVTRVDTKPRRPSQSSLESAPKPTPRPPEPVEDEPRSRATVFDQLSAVRVEAVPLPPRYTFLTGVFEFPWRRNSVVRWLYQSFGWLVLLCVLATMQTVASQYAQSMFGLVLAFFALPLIWIGFWSCSYAASNFLCVVEATAAGQDKIVEWPDPNWREWMIQLIYLLWIGAIPAILGFCLVELLPEMNVPKFLVSLGIACATYPICLMSALETNSPWTPFSGVIFLSLLRNFGTWIGFYVATGLTWLPLVAVLFLADRLNPYLISALAAPLAAAIVLILGRLFGRLAWKISGIERKWARIRRPVDV